MVKLLGELSKAGRLVRVEKTKIDREISKISGRCKSNDVHVIGLARASRTRLLCTLDNLLTEDFKNNHLLKRGKVYRSREHTHLIKECCAKVH